MMLTVGNWIFVGIILIIGIIIVAYKIYQDEYTITSLIVTIVIILLICGIYIIGISWWHNNTATGARAMKDYQSNIDNGINRHLQIIADDGKVIYEREGKFDLEIQDHYVIFDENHQRTVIYRSYTTTMVIEEIEQ